MKKIILSLLLTLNLLSAEETNIDALLGKIEKKTDLSSKTKLENGGISTIYTREDLRKMQAKTLKDILKSLSPIGYKENRYGLSDPYFMGTTHPFVSSSIRIFMDDQELSTGLYGSGMITYGNIELNFIDHVEIYTGNPTYEFSTEPTYILIKLYSKKAQKDAGSKVSAQVGNFGDSLFSIYNTGEFDKGWSYFAYASQNNDKREKYTSHSTELSRDTQTTHVFASIYDDKNKILIDAGKVAKDSFIDKSLDATPQDATIKYDSLHIGYNGEHKNLSYLLSYDYLHTKTNFSDDVTPLAQRNYMFPLASVNTVSKSYVISSELKYSYTTETNKFISGLKYRFKGFKYDTYELNGFNVPRTGNTKQTIATAFVENQYSLQKNSIITTGVSASQVHNNNSVQDYDNLLMYRVGHTYTTQNFVFKSIYSHVELTLDPYLVNSLFIVPGKKDITKQNLFLEDIIYQKESNKYELILSLLRTKNQLVPNINSGLLENYKKTIEVKSALFKWTYEYRQFDKLYIDAEYNTIDNIPGGYSVKNSMRQYKATVRNLNTYKKFDFFNELLYFRDTIQKENFYDYSAGVVYHANEDLSVSLKATNILNRAQTTSYYRVDPNTFQPEAPLQISPIDRHIMLSMEYLF